MTKKKEKSKEPKFVVLPIKVREPAARAFRSLATSCGVTQMDLFGMVVHSMKVRLHGLKELLGFEFWDATPDGDLLKILFELDMGRLSKEDFEARCEELKRGKDDKNE